MRLLDEQRQRWYCYKDDQVFLAKEQRWGENVIERATFVPPSTPKLSIRGLCGLIPVDRKWAWASGSLSMPSELPQGTYLGALKFVLPGTLYVTEDKLLCHSSEILMTETTNLGLGFKHKNERGAATYFVEYSLTPNTEVSLAPIKPKVPEILAVTIQPLEYEQKPYTVQVLSTHSRVAGKLEFRQLSLSGGYVNGTLLGDEHYQQLKSAVDRIRSQVGQKTRVY